MRIKNGGSVRFTTPGLVANSTTIESMGEVGHNHMAREQQEGHCSRVNREAWLPQGVWLLTSGAQTVLIRVGLQMNTMAALTTALLAAGLNLAVMKPSWQGSGFRQ